MYLERSGEAASSDKDNRMIRLTRKVFVIMGWTISVFKSEGRCESLAAGRKVSNGENTHPYREILIFLTANYTRGRIF